MRSRILITALLTVGVLMGTAGSALALSDGTNASVEQYGSSGGSKSSSSTPAPTATLVPPPATVVPPPVVTTPPSTPEVTEPTPTTESNPPVVQAPKQLKEGELPFTGFAVIPVLLFGIALLAGGLALRRSMRGRAAGAQI
jgi:hypothetical protein